MYNLYNIFKFYGITFSANTYFKYIEYLLRIRILDEVKTSHRILMTMLLILQAKVINIAYLNFLKMETNTYRLSRLIKDSSHFLIIFQTLKKKGERLPFGGNIPIL